MSERLAADGLPVGERAENVGRGDSLATYIRAARDAAPDGATDLEVLSVGHAAWSGERDVADLWREVSDGD